MPRKNGNKQIRDYQDKIIKTAENVSKKKELLEEFAANLTPEEQDRAKSKLANKLKSIKEMTKSTRVE